MVQTVKKKITNKVLKNIPEFGNKRTILGKMGELIIQFLHEDLKDKVELVDNQFDNKKDLIINGEHVEVKCIVPYFKKNAFSIKKDHYYKCQKAKKFYYIAPPSDAWPDDEYTGGVFLIDLNHADCKTEIETVKSKFESKPRDMVLIFREQSEGVIKRVYTIKDKNLLDKMRELSNSNYGRK